MVFEHKKIFLTCLNALNSQLTSSWEFIVSRL